MVYKVFIPAGGIGDRLKPLTDVRPKVNVYLDGDKRIGEFVMDRCIDAGYNHLFFAVQHMRDSVMAKFGDGSSFGYKQPLSITYAGPPNDTRFVGTADALRKSRIILADEVQVRDMEEQTIINISPQQMLENPERYEYLGQPEETYEGVLVSNADILTSVDYEKLVDFHKSRGGIATIALYRMEPQRIVGNFGMASIDQSNRVTKFTEKPRKIEGVDSELVSIGIYVFDRAIYKILEENRDVKDFAKDLFPFLLEKYPGDFFGFPMDGYWDDIGTLDAYYRTNLQMIQGIPGIDLMSRRRKDRKSNRVQGRLSSSKIAQGCYIEEGSEVTGSVLGDGVQIVGNSRVRNCVVMNGAIIEGADVNNVILDAGAAIYGAKIPEMVVIGADTKIHSDATIKPKTRRDKSGLYRLIGAGHTLKSCVVEEDIPTEFDI